MASGVMKGLDANTRVRVSLGKDEGKRGVVVTQRKRTHWHLVWLDGDDRPTWIHFFHLKQEEISK